ncbi:MAG: XdhC family protein [Anaerovoracaceae bacterium]
MSQKIQYFAKDLLEQGKGFVLASVIDTTGSTPRKSGAWMIMKEDGSFLGTVGGGKIEAVTQEHCKEHLKTKETKEYHFKLNTEDKDALDMGCGGEALVRIEYIHGENKGEFLKEWESKTKAYIFGGGHVGLALEPVLRHIDFRITVTDDREEYANKDRFPLADVRVVKGYENCFDGLSCDEDTYIVIVTRGHMGDYVVLKQALAQPSAYVGMIGSRKKNEILFDQLREEGVAEEDIRRVYAPIGESIHAETPEEIAISIAAEMIRVRSGHGSR